ncbi:hypothetical protein M8J77_025790 [Diaphorina citri]|nr:hypothetical protein M8J77_025790 [Diaphorina citri]
MTVDFTDYFWGDKNTGFDVLYHNMKHGLIASKELSDFLRERANIEENNSKLFGKLAKQSGGSGTFAPLWQVLKTSIEKIATVQVKMMQKVNDLVKDVCKYTEELQKKHKLVKEEQGPTLEIVQTIQSTTLVLQKAKDVYLQKCEELDKLRRDNGSAKDLEKAELKVKKAQEDYKTIVDKYALIKEDFEKRMSTSCKYFQQIEEAHLKQMKEFLSTYTELIENNHDAIGQIYLEFKRQCLELTIDKLLEHFVLKKYTGLEKPGIITQVPREDLIPNLPLVNLNPTDPPLAETKPSVSLAGSGDSKPPKREGFLRSRREKRKEKKKNKKRDGSDSTGKEVRDEKENSEPKSEAPTPEVDEEGYRIRPKEEMWDAEKFYSSSDSDSDDDRDHKIHVEIKPLSANTNQISASVDELRVTAGNLTLSPLSVKERRNSIDINPEVNFSQSPHKKINGLAELNHALMKTMGDSASTEDKPDHVDPTEPPLGLLSGNTPPPSSSTSTEKTTSDSSSTSKYTNLGDLFSEVGEIVPALPPKQTARMTPTLTSSTISLPRPPSRRSEGRGHISPLNSTLTRSESEFKTSGVSTTNSSRGPSPLTIGMSDTIPLAVAFHEIIHSYFRGTDETRCQVKMSGDMMLSFPAGIVSILTSNPSPAQLKFKVSNISHIENMLPNKQLINIEENKLDKSSDSMTCEFNMSALSSLLRKQCEQNPSASYFNVDILKYQIKSKPGAESCPFQLVAHWKCEPTHTDLKVDYKYNNHAMGSPSPLLNVVLAVPVDGEVTNVQAKPNVQWLPETNRAIWKFTDLSQHSENHGIGCVKARFELKNGPGTPSTIATQFNCEGTTLSGAEFELIGPGYRVSLVKRKFMSGKYICDGDFDNRYGIIPSPSPSDFN